MSSEGFRLSQLSVSEMIRLRNIRTVAMPIGMVVGALLCRQITAVEELSRGMITPVLIFSILFLTYCKVDIRRMRLSWLHVWLLLFQLVGSVGVFMLLAPFNEIVAQGATSQQPLRPLRFCTTQVARVVRWSKFCQELHLC